MIVKFPLYLIIIMVSVDSRFDKLV